MIRRFAACVLSPALLLAFVALYAVERPAHAANQGGSLLGVIGHFLHHDLFFLNQSRLNEAAGAAVKGQSQ
jgi:hypothetical protein